jgi:catechol 2,3-dioxygenase
MPDTVEPAQNPFFLRVSLSDVVLRVRRIAEARRFYGETLGLKAVSDAPSRVAFSATGRAPALIVLEEDADAPEAPAGSAGLFHAALLYPGRAELAAAVRRLVGRGHPFEGAADHGVSEALYLSDPAGNGLELYADKPPGSWPVRGGELAMVSDPLDVGSLLSESPADAPEAAAPPGLRLGHVHLRGHDLATAEPFYAGCLGFPVRQRSYRGALFFGRDGYHHHLAVNTWQSRRPCRPGSLGLAGFAIGLSDPGEFSRVRAALGAAGAVVSDGPDGVRASDPSGIALRIFQA